MSIYETIDHLTTAINGEQPAWLFLEAVGDNPLVLNVSLLRPLTTAANDNSPEEIAAAVAELFDALADHIRESGKLRVSHPVAALASAGNSG